jgi:hypothetical protein
MADANVKKAHPGTQLLRIGVTQCRSNRGTELTTPIGTHRAVRKMPLGVYGIRGRSPRSASGSGHSLALTPRHERRARTAPVGPTSVSRAASQLAERLTGASLPKAAVKTLADIFGRASETDLGGLAHPPNADQPWQPAPLGRARTYAALLPARVRAMEIGNSNSFL